MAPNTPGTWWSGQSNPDAEPDNERNWERGVLALVGLILAPIPAVIATITYLVFQFGRVSYRVFAVAAAVYWAAFAGVYLFVLGGTATPISNYWAPYTALLSGEPLTANAWILAQAPLGVGVGLTAGAGYAYYRWVRRPVWEQIELRATPWEWWRRRRVVREIASDHNPPLDGMTLGVDSFGNRVVMTSAEASAHTFLTGRAGTGKALAVTTPIPTPTGFIPMGDLQAGDWVFGTSGEPVEVTGAFDVMVGHDCYDVTFTDGTVITADAEHLWTVTDPDGETVTVTTRSLAADPTAGWVVPSHGSAMYPDDTVAIDEDTILDKLDAAIGNTNVSDAGHPQIPVAYLTGSTTVRLITLLRLLGTKGLTVWGTDEIRLTTEYEAFARDIHELASSLGTTATLALVPATLGEPEWRVTLPRPFTTGDRAPVRRIAAITPVATVPVRCIAVDAPDHLFLAGRTYVPTHNTQTMLMLARDAIAAGHGYVYVDLKGAPDVPAVLAEYATRYGRRFQHFVIQDSRLPYDGPADAPSYYDPAGRGDPSRRKDLLIGSRSWDMHYFKQVCENYLQTAFRVAAIVPPQPGVGTFEDLVTLLQPDNLGARAELIPASHRDFPVLSAEVARLTLKMDAQEASGVRGMLMYMQTLVGSTAGGWLRRDPSGQRDIDLMQVAHEGSVVVFSLSSGLYQELSASIAGLIVQDLKTLSAELRLNPAPRPLHIVLDEFQAAGTDNVLGLIDKCRDANMPVIISTQALGNLAAIEPNYVARIAGIVNSFIIHGTNVAADAELFAGLTGTTTRYHRVLNVEHRSALPGGNIGLGAATGAGRAEEVEEYQVMPSDILNLGRGRIVYVAKTPDMRVIHPVDVIRDNQTAAISDDLNDRVGSYTPPVTGATGYPDTNTNAYSDEPASAYPAQPPQVSDGDVNHALTDALNAIDNAPIMPRPTPGVPLGMGPVHQAIPDDMFDPAAQPAPIYDTPHAEPVQRREFNVTEFDPWLANPEPVTPPASVSDREQHPAAVNNQEHAPGRRLPITPPPAPAPPASAVPGLAQVMSPFRSPTSPAEPAAVVTPDTSEASSDPLAAALAALHQAG